MEMVHLHLHVSIHIERHLVVLQLMLMHVYVIWMIFLVQYPHVLQNFQDNMHIVIYIVYMIRYDWEEML